MSSINPEMLKQLLSEFEEKQAVCREEINEITNQISELEQRIESSKERLVSVARDREKIGLMKQRYQDGDWSSVLSQVSKTSNGSGLTTARAIEPPAAQTGDYPPVNVGKVELPPPNLAPQPVIAPPGAQEFPPAFVSEPAPLPAPTPEVSPPEVSSPAPAEAAPPNPFEQAPAAQANQFQQDVPSWDAPQPFQQTEPQPAAQAAPPPPSEGLFPFSGQQVQADAANGADIPWAPPPTMTWESVGNHTFPNQGAPDPTQGQFPQPQPQAPPPAFQGQSYDSNPFGGGQSPFQQQQQTPEMQPPGLFADPSQGAQTGAPPAFMPSAQNPAPPNANSQAVLTTAFDEEFDISDALRGEDENANTDSRDTDKKIKDALRGLFS